MLFWLFGYISGYIAIMGVALSIAVGLYSVAELAEEYPSLTGKVIRYIVIGVFVIHVLLLIDGLPFYEKSIGILSHCAYASLLRDYPFVKTVSLEAIFSVVAFIVSHYTWFQYFVWNRHDFFTILGFFFVMIWIVPFGFFVSLSINENILPGIEPRNHSNGINGKSMNIFKFIYDSAKNIVDGLNLGKKMNIASKSSCEKLY